MESITVLGGHGKFGQKDSIASLTMRVGELYTIVGNTGAGKSRFIKDLEQLANGDSPTGRRVLLDGEPVNLAKRSAYAGEFIAHLSQNMRFVLDLTVASFLELHSQCRGKMISPESVLEVANQITPEPISAEQSLNILSGGQSRALMIADIARICDSPLVLIDEVENGGIDKIKALNILTDARKLVLIVTHDPQIALMAEKRLIFSGGAITALLQRSAKEKEIYEHLAAQAASELAIQQQIRQGVYW